MAQLASFLHAAQHFKVCSGGDNPKDFWGSATCDMSQKSELWSIHKGHVPSTILNCDEPLLTRPPDDIFSHQKSKQGKRQVRGTLPFSRFFALTPFSPPPVRLSSCVP